MHYNSYQFTNVDGKLVSCASDLEMARVHMVISVMDEVGVARDYQLLDNVRVDGELQASLYVSSDGRKLTIFND